MMAEAMSAAAVWLLLGQAGWEPPRGTEFLGGGVGIDPADCGCTDCIVGNSYPENRIDTTVILACLAMGRPIFDRR